MHSSRSSLQLRPSRNRPNPRWAACCAWDAAADSRRSEGTRSTGNTRGFTLLEVLLTLALIGLLAAVLIGGGMQLMDQKPRSADDVFWSAVQEARKMALKSEHDVSLKYVDDKEKGKAFIVTDGSALKAFPIPAPGDLEVTFLSQQKGGTLIMIAGTVLETQKVETVTFYADGTCSAIRVQFFRNGATHVTSVDPWTCAPLLTPADANASTAPAS